MRKHASMAGTGIGFAAFVVWWAVRHASVAPLFPLDIVGAYLVACGPLTLTWGVLSREAPRRAAMGAGLSTSVLAWLAVGLAAMPSPAMIAWCSVKGHYCEDFSGVLLLLGFWLVGLVCAALAALIAMLAHGFSGA
jgi:hypothetical protein